MIGKQLDLFGGPPKPPKKIRVEEDEPATLPSDGQISGNKDSEVIVENSVEESASGPLPAAPEVFVQLPKAVDVSPAVPSQDFYLSETNPEEALQEELPEVTADNEQMECPSNIEPDSSVHLDQSNESESGDDQETLMPVADERHTETDGLPGSAIHEQVSHNPDPEISMADASDMEETAGTIEIGTDEGDDQEEETEVNRASEDDIANEDLKKKDEGVNTHGLSIPEDNILYSRQYYTMRETAAMFNVNQSLLRFWENEFDVLKPKKNRKGDRYFRPDDIRNLEMIHHLLKVRKFTIEGAKEYIKSRKRSLETFEMVQRLEKLKLFLQELKTSI